ncbi:MAG: hypothetical protein H7Y88_04790 [Phycisphaerales bacterium]|nr:hypothetical protein [Phycisphaerales bacterium]
MFRGVFHGGAALLMALGAVGGGATRAWAQADDNPVMLQWFETRWQTMERRVPDFFMAGYDGVWLPPPSRAGDSSSPGYDVFDRFDLGRPGNPTIYGTEEGFRAVLAELQRAGALVYVDSIFNHNSGRTSNAQFHAQGGWPGFVTNLPGDFWGDFHTGQFQSIDPGGPNYNLWEGDLVGLIDIAQEENLQYIRHPVDAANPLNIPPGTVRNRPDAANARFYPDLDLPPVSFVNPAQPGHPWTIYPFNTEDPYAGDPVADNATGLLMRWAQWMLDDVGVDGFRLDAAKHIPQWFWNQYFDTAVYQRRRTAWGALVTPLSFVESVDSNSFTQTYLRKDGFGFRDGLDLNGAGQLRDLLNAQGFGTWGNVLSSHLDNQDDGNGTNGSQGVMHVFSHDNGSAGDGGSAPPVPGVNRYALPEHAYLMFRPGLPIVYHNSREMIDLYSSRGFWPREGNPTALSVGGGGGGGAPDLVELVQIAGGYARGDYRGLNFTDTVNPSTNDVLVFERRTQVGPGVFAANVLVGMNDRYDAGFQQRSVQTSFAPGTRLRELTGNHADAMVDPAGGGDQVPQFLIVDANRRVLIRVPNNASSGGQHHKGYVVYGPAAPSGVVMIDGATGVVPPDGAGVPSYRRRLTAMEVVTTESFGLSLVTSQTDLLDPNTDDFAAFRIDEGFVDRNGNGEVDIGPESPTLPGFEQFVTFNSPLLGSGNANGAYYQTIDATVLEEGPHFVTVRAFRHRDDGGLPIYGEFRKVVYVDREPPAAALVEPGEGGFVGALSYEFAVRALDRTVDSVHILLNVPEGSDPVALCNAGSRATQTDRFEFRRTIGGLPIGASTVTMVAFEATGSHAIETVTFVVNIGTGDVNLDGEVGVEDLYDAFMLAGEGYLAPLDMDENGLIDVRDYRLLEAAIRSGELLDMTEGQR